MAELADALRSGRSEGSLMWVQVPPSAHKRLAAASLSILDLRLPIFDFRPGKRQPSRTFFARLGCMLPPVLFPQGLHGTPSDLRYPSSIVGAAGSKAKSARSGIIIGDTRVLHLIGKDTKS